MNSVFLIWTGNDGNSGHLAGIAENLEIANGFVKSLHPDFTLEHDPADKDRRLYARVDKEVRGQRTKWARIDEHLLLK